MLSAPCPVIPACCSLKKRPACHTVSKDFLHLIVLHIPSSAHASERSFLGKEMQCAGNYTLGGLASLQGVYFGSGSMGSEPGKNDLVRMIFSNSLQIVGSRVMPR